MPGTSVSHTEPSLVSQPAGEAEQTPGAPGKLPKAVQGQAPGQTRAARAPQRLQPGQHSADAFWCTEP